MMNMLRTKSHWLVGTLAVALLAGTFGDATSVRADDTKFKIGSSRDLQLGAQLGMAMHKGFFKEEGLDIEVAYFTSGAEMTSALAAGQLQLGSFGDFPTVNMIAANLPVKIITGVAEISGTQQLVVKKGINKPEDLKGKKIRVYSTTLGDFVEGAGGVSVTIPFAEVVPALQKGVADCGITGTMPAYRAKWYEVVTHAYLMRVGYTATFAAINLKTWDRLSAEAQDLLTQEFAAFENRAWDETIKEDEMGIICNTNVGDCTEGDPGSMKKVVPSEADLKVRETILHDFVLKRWAERCGAECVKEWNATVGAVVGIEAPVL
jgi:hypothetical protein